MSNKKIHLLKLIFTLLVLIIQLSLLSPYNACAADAEDKKLEVLFISSFNNNFVSFNDQLNGIKKGLNNNANIRIEYMNSKIFSSRENEENFYNLLKCTFENYDNLDAVIAGDDDAAEFCIKYRDDLFKNIPISFLGVQNPKRFYKALEYDNVSGVAEIDSIKENIEFIRKFHPDVDTITFLDVDAKIIIKKSLLNMKILNLTGCLHLKCLLMS